MSCGTDRELMRLMIKDIIDQLIADGTIQGGLLTCDGAALPTKQKMKDCASAEAADAALDAKIDKVKTDTDAALKVVVAELEAKLAAKKDTFPTEATLTSDLVLQLLLNNGETVSVSLAALKPTPYVNAMEMVNKDTLRVTRSDNEKFETTLPMPTALAVDKNKLVLTLNTGDKVEADLCGWRGAQPCTYHATLNIALERGEAGCADRFARVVYGFHPEDIRDPAADVQLVDCKDRVIGYIYSAKGGNHTVEYAVEQKDGTMQVIGYALASPVVHVWSDECCADLFGRTP